MTLRLTVVLTEFLSQAIQVASDSATELRSVRELPVIRAKSDLHTPMIQRAITEHHNMILERNISCLYTTARLEIDRKDAELSKQRLLYVLPICCQA